MNIWVECVLDNKNMIFPILQETYPDTIMMELKRRMMEAAIAIVQTDETKERNEHRFFVNNDVHLMHIKIIQF